MPARWIQKRERITGTLPLVVIVLVVLFVAWRLFLRTQGTWVEVPADPHAYVHPELVPLVDWMARQAEAQIGRGLVIAGDPFALGTIAEAAETALAEQRGAETIEIVVSPFIGDGEGMYGFDVTLDREQREQFNL